MDAWPGVAGEYVAAGEVAFCTPTPTYREKEKGGNRGRSDGPAMAGLRERSEEQTRRNGDGERVFCKVYQKRNEWLGRWVAEDDTIPVRRNDDRFTGNQSARLFAI